MTLTEKKNIKIKKQHRDELVLCAAFPHYFSL